MTKLLKVHGSENHFFILDQTQLKNQLSDNELSNLARDITNPDNGVLGGADGVLVVNHAGSQDALGQMRVINADGSEASMCGNGLRTIARYLSEKHHQDQFKVETITANLDVSKQKDLADHVPAFSVEISPVKFNKEAFPFDHLETDQIMNRKILNFDPDLRFTAIALPNPHLISFVKNKNDFKKLGPLGKQLNGKNPYFPDGVNVSFAKILGHNELFVQTYERGVGFTNACGTGMSATSLAFLLNYPNDGDYDHIIKVKNPGGMVKTNVHHQNGKYWINLIGNATFTDVVDVDEDDLHNADVSKNNVKIQSTGEENAYQKFVKTIKK
ncbi:diaminopimelate epimerase [Philodulcilactobacillus myokoensis]|uniref:Diaminopimelate epimerase n=1 Tax=Philodulcilactobacillus myokoensis TaxID=2929573 RepID=A0A9W6B186_9LACO|nr:diaminopimelate epimerase [Philodulcilactobacillus myokoensis]GLB46528.1 diaminopimelate epimerase [Philodulcilactobacillus myokoensis]